MDVRCRKTTCKHNKTHSCFAKSIKISEKVQCATYHVDDVKEIKKDNKATDMSKKIYKEESIKDSPHRSRKTIHLLCDADCLFNLEGICKTNGIIVNDLGEPYCINYLKK